MNKRLLNIFLIFQLFAALQATCQNFDSLSLKEQREIQMRSHVLVHLDSVNDKALNRVLHLDLPLGVYASDSDDVNTSFLSSVAPELEVVFILNNNEQTSVVKSQDTRVYVFNDAVDSLHITKHLESVTDLKFQEKGVFGLLTLQKTLVPTDSIFVNLWKRSGKLPNFIYATRNNLDEVLQIVDTLNKIPKTFGVVRTEEALLSDVSFEGFRDRTVNGFFTFPFEGEAIIPHKAGYYFSPDIISPNLENRGNLKEFVGYPLQSDYQLTYHFTFGNEVRNVVEEGNNEFLSNAVVARKDSIHGTVGYFSDRAYIDTGIAGKSALKSNFSITAWIKPTELNVANGILSKGFNFVVKIHEGHLTFTSAGIKDYKSLSSPIPINEWTHIGLVHSSINNDLTFYINGVQTDKIEMISEYENSEYNLLVGNNIWEEFFVGYLSSIKIWERELNAAEIFDEFSRKPTKLSFANRILIIAASLLLLFMFLFWSLRQWKSRKKLRSVKPYKFVDRLEKRAFKEQILCFGKLRIETSEGVDIANKFSPMMKKIFVVVFVHSLKRDQGISTKNLTEYIWPGMDAKRAKNTRGTTIQNLRSLLSDCNEIDLVFKDKQWLLEIGTNCYCDYMEARGILDRVKEYNHSVEVLEAELPDLLALLSKGRFFSNSSEPWLDSFVEKFSIEIIEQCFEFAEKLTLKNHFELLFLISEVIYLYDDLNEKALEIKLRVLVYQGKFSLANSVFDNFIKLYEKIYKELYPFDFDQFLSKKAIK